MQHESFSGAARTAAALAATLLLPGALSSCAWRQRIAGGAAARATGGGLGKPDLSCGGSRQLLL